MSDEIVSATVIFSETVALVEVEPPRPPAPLHIHYCEHPGCPNWGGLGFTRYKSEAPRWFCGEHRDDGEQVLSGARR